ncbi:hypothetical protein PSACC_02331, partial [Paramicrosporidium saccamoebae]
MRIILAASILLVTVTGTKSLDDTLDNLKSSNGPKITRYVRHALDSECYMEMLETAMPTLSALLTKQWGSQETYNDAMRATLDLTHETLPADLITSLWSGVTPTFDDGDTRQFLNKVREMEAGLEVQMRFVAAMLLKMPGAFKKHIGKNDKSQFSSCLKFANAMSLTSSKGVKKNFASCAGDTISEDTMRALDVIFINFGHLVDVYELIDRDHWLLSGPAHDMAMLTGSRFIIHLHQQKKTQKWKSFKTWLQEGGADPQDLISTLPLSTIVMIMFDTRLQKHGAGRVEFADWLWASNAAATQYLRTLADRHPEPIFEDLDEHSYSMFPRPSRSIGQIQDDTESVVCGLLMLHCFLQENGIDGACRKVRNLAVHPMVAVRRAMATHQYDIVDTKWSKRHFALLPFIDFEQYTGANLKVIPKKLPVGAAMVQNAASVCTVLDCEGHGVRARTSEYANSPQHGHQYRDDEMRSIRGQGLGDDHFGSSYAAQSGQAPTMNGYHPQPSAPPMDLETEDEMWSSGDPEQSIGYTGQSARYADYPEYSDAPMGYSNQYSEHFNQSSGYSDQAPDHYDQAPGYSNQPSEYFGHSPGYPDHSSAQHPGRSAAGPATRRPTTGYSVDHTYQANSMSQVPPGLEDCTDIYNRCIKNSIYSLLSTRLNEEEATGLMSHM